MVFRGTKIDVFQRFVPLGNFGTVLWGQGLESPLARPGCVPRFRVFVAFVWAVGLLRYSSC